MSAVVFAYLTWQARFPELSQVPQGIATAYFEDACDILNNSGRSAIQDMDKRGRILNLLTAHIAKLNYPLNGEPASPLVGRINSASEGSVSVGTDLQVPGSAQWFAQTPYGLSAWQAMAGARTFHYFSGARRRGF